MKISLDDLEVFYQLTQVRSIRELARRRNQEPGHVSKTVQKVETWVGVSLLERTNKGMSLTQKGFEVQKRIERILQESLELSQLHQTDFQEGQQKLSVASISFLSTRLIGSAVNDLLQSYPQTAVQVLDLPPDQMVMMGLKGAFDLAVHMGALQWPKTWETTEIGTLKWKLYASHTSSLPSQVSVERIKNQPFVYPLYLTLEGLQLGVDHCPLKLSQRIKSIGTTTADAALKIVSGTNHLGFFPELIAAERVKRKELKEIKVNEWKSVEKTLYLSARADQVKQKLFSEFASFLKKQI